MTVHAPDVLAAALGHMQDRAATYDKPAGERSMGATVTAFNAVTGHNLTEEQGWLLMGLLKMVRSQQGALRMDNYEDEAAYAALRAEAAHRERFKPAAAVDKEAAMSQHLAQVLSPPQFDETRADIIGQNGNDGEHYQQETPEPPKKPETRQPEAEVSAAKVASDSADKKSRSQALAAIASAATLADPTGRPSWDQAPNWANYLTQNSKGVWVFWQNEPAIIGSGWVKRGGLFQEFNSGELAGNWKESLSTAPGLTRT